MAELPAETPLRFKPITPGLGFHPFSEGLPYSPAPKTPGLSRAIPPKPQAAPLNPPAPSLPGSQNVAAAAARAAHAFPTRPPLATATGTLAAAAAARPAAAPAPATITVRPADTRVISSSITAETQGFGYLLKRTLAFFTDIVVVTALCAGAFGGMLWFLRIPVDSLLGPDVALLTFTFLGAFLWSMIVAQEMAFGTTIGKRLFGLVLIGSPAAIFLRAFFFLPSLGFAGVGLLWALFDPQRRCWHDLASEVQPTELAEL